MKLIGFLKDLIKGKFLKDKSSEKKILIFFHPMNMVITNFKSTEQYAYTIDPRSTGSIAARLQLNLPFNDYHLPF